VTRLGLPEVFLCRQRIAVVLLHRCQNAQVALYPAVVVVDDIIFNHLHKLLTARKSSAVVPLTLENTPKAFHRAVVNTLGYSGHTLSHLRLLQLVVEYSVGVLETSVAMKQRMGIWIGFNSGIQGVEYERIIIAVTNNKGNDSAVVQIKDCAKVQLAYIGTFVPLKLCHICQLLLIGHTCVKLAVQPVLGDVLRIGSLSGTAIVLVFNGRLDIQATANAQHPFLIHIQLVVVGQVVLDATVAFVRIPCMDLLHNLSDYLVFQLSGTLFATEPSVVGCSRHAKQIAR